MIHSIHRTWLKCLVNPVLHKFQYWTDEPYVIASVFKREEFIRYKIARVKYYRNAKIPDDVKMMKAKHPVLKTLKYIWRKLCQN